jgi:cytoskeletal protein CcmA (bactofilin family)
MAWLGQKAERPAGTADEKPVSEAPASVAGGEVIAMQNLVNIGKSVQIKGELTGSEDLTIDGHLEGKIHMKEHHLTVGTNSTISAEIHAKSVTILGKVTGNIVAGEKVEVATSGTMLGDIRSPRVALADGAKFKGSIDMEPRAGQAARPAAQGERPAAATTPEQQNVRVTA